MVSNCIEWWQKKSSGRIGRFVWITQFFLTDQICFVRSHLPCTKYAIFGSYLGIYSSPCGVSRHLVGCTQPACQEQKSCVNKLDPIKNISLTFHPSIFVLKNIQTVKPLQSKDYMGKKRKILFIFYITTTYYQLYNMLQKGTTG